MCQARICGRVRTQGLKTVEKKKIRERSITVFTKKLVSGKVLRTRTQKNRNDYYSHLPLNYSFSFDFHFQKL